SGPEFGVTDPDTGQQVMTRDLPPERLDAALQKASQTFDLWQSTQLGPCSSNPSATPVVNLVPATICSVPPQGTIPPQDTPTVRIDILVSSSSPKEALENAGADVLTGTNQTEAFRANGSTIISVQEVVVAIATGSPLPIATPAYKWPSSD